MVDANLRLASRIPSYRSSKRRTIWFARIVPAAAFIASSQSAGRSSEDWLMIVAGAAVAGTLSGYVFARFHEWFLRNQHRRMLAGQLDPGSTVHGEIELRSGEVWVRQQDNELTFPWSQAAEVADTGDAIELRFKPGLVVVRNRFFSTASHRQQFFDTARRLALRD